MFGYELGERGWPTDFAWDDSQIKIAVVVAPDTHGSQAEEERRKRDEAYADDGWTVRTATDWLDQLDTLLTLLPDTEGSHA
ncbi:MrfA-like Zn-binding domain-containing protein OS=Streptomyces microflavus OX=1919 GN=Smic_65490 PE=4 SV=1 [Streptomyces microflavus]